MGERDDAKREIDEARERMSEVADELSRRTSGSYVAQRTREAAVDKTSEWAGKARRSPATLGLIGGTVGALVGTALGKASLRRRSAIEARREVDVSRSDVTLGEQDRGRMSEAKDRLEEAKESAQGRYAEAKEGLKDRLAGMKESAAETSDSLKARTSAALDTAKARGETIQQRLPSRGEVSSKVSSRYHQAVVSDPLLLGIGGLFLGMIAGFLIPESSRERQRMAPLKDKARGQIQETTQKIESKLDQLMGGEAEESVAPPVSPTERPRVTPEETGPSYH